MDVTTGVNLIGPAYRRQSTVIRKGFWTPLLAKWSAKDGFSEERDLQFYSYEAGEKVTGATVNACPVLCILKSDLGHNDLVVQVTGLLGQPDSGSSVTTGGVTITGFEKDEQYNLPVYRRVWVTGGGTFEYQFTIPQYTQAGKVYRMPNKRIYKITNISVSGHVPTQEIASLGFYALGDNGSKLLYSFNWDKLFEYYRKVFHGAYGHPNKCVRCNGSGYIGTSTNTCQQCDGYGYDGPNASGYLETQLGYDVGLEKDVDESDQTFRNKLWAYNWLVTPTSKEIKRYFAHFGRIDTDEIEISKETREALPTGIESIVNLYMPHEMPFSIFPQTDIMWTNMAESIQPAGVDIVLSFLTQSFTGTLDLEELSSIYMSGYQTGTFTGTVFDNWVYGFDANMPTQYTSSSWYSDWGDDWHFFNIIPSSHASGYISGSSGYAVVSGVTYTYISGSTDSDEWYRWAWPSSGIIQGGVAGMWSTGETQGLVQQNLWDSGTFYLDNFWASGVDLGIQY